MSMCVLLASLACSLNEFSDSEDHHEYSTMTCAIILTKFPAHFLHKIICYNNQSAEVNLAIDAIICQQYELKV